MSKASNFNVVSYLMCDIVFTKVLKWYNKSWYQVWYWTRWSFSDKIWWFKLCWWYGWCKVYNM